MRTQRKFLSLLVVLCMLLAMLPTAFAADEPALSGTCGDNLTWELTENGGTVTVDGEELPAYTLTISGTGDMELYSFWGEDWDYRAEITSVVIRDGVTSINDSAFAYCKNLTEVDIPDTVTSIGEYAFVECAALDNVIIPEGVTAIGVCTFNFCTSLSRISIPEGVTFIGAYAFAECSSLTHIELPSTVELIDTGAFINLLNMDSYPYVVPDFFYNGTLAEWGEVKIADDNTLLYWGIHFNDGLVGGYYSDGDGLYWLLDDGGKLTVGGAEKIPDDTGPWWVRYYEDITAVVIEDGVTSIGSEAFELCLGLTSVIIPASVTSIGDAAFAGCDDDLTIYGYTKTTAETYAAENDIPFVDLNDGPAVLGGGTSKSYTQESGEDATIYCSGDLEDFVSVSVDGEVVSEDNYTLAEGCTIVTLKSTYLDTLSVGEHTVTLTYTTGTASTTLTVLEKGTQLPDDSEDPTDPENPGNEQPGGQDPENPGDENPGSENPADPENPGDEGTGSEGTAPSEGSDVPQTGSAFTASAWGALLMIALAAAVMMAVNRRNWFKF